MLGDISRVQKYFIICGHTDMRAGIEGLRMDFLDSSDGVLRNFVTAFSGKS